MRPGTQVFDAPDGSGSVGGVLGALQQPAAAQRAAQRAAAVPAAISSGPQAGDSGSSSDEDAAGSGHDEAAAVRSGVIWSGVVRSAAEVRALLGDESAASGANTPQEAQQAGGKGRSPYDTAKAYAVKVLGQSPQCTQELRSKLEARGYEALVVEQVLARMTEARLLDDAAYARLYARSKWANNLSSPTKVAYELQRKGVARELVHDALREGFGSTTSVYVPAYEDEDTDASARLVDAAERQLRGARAGALSGKEAQAARRRVASWLAYRGHGPGTAAQVMKRLGL